MNTIPRSQSVCPVRSPVPGSARSGQRRIRGPAALGRAAGHEKADQHDHAAHEKAWKLAMLIFGNVMSGAPI